VNYAQLYVAIQSYVQDYGDDFNSNIPTFVREAERRIYNSVQLAYLRKTLVGTLAPGDQYLSTPADFLSTYALSLIRPDGTFEFLLDKDVNFLRSAYPDPTETGEPKYYALFGPVVSGGLFTNNLAYMFAPTPAVTYQLEISYYYYPPSIVSGVITGTSFTTGGQGSGYNSGVYYNVPLTGGAGASATATLNIVAGAVITCTIENGGSLYLVGDTLTSTDVRIGNGSGFSITVTTINNSSGTSWLGDSYEQVLLYACLVEAYGYMKGEADMMAYYQQKYDQGIQQLKRLGDGLERGDAYRDGQFKMKVTS
jgi:hypothetical protein